MIRLVLTMMFWVVVGRYVYAEMNILVPAATPYIDKFLVAVQIPTHNKWDPELLGNLTAGIKRQGSQLVAETGILPDAAFFHPPQHHGQDSEGLDATIVRAISASRGTNRLERF